jgi:hypothetical protein
VGCLDQIALDAQYQPVLRIKKPRPQPTAVFGQQLLAEGREECPRVKERPLLLDDAVAGYGAEANARRHGELRSDACGVDGLSETLLASPCGWRSVQHVARS